MMTIGKGETMSQPIETRRDMLRAAVMDAIQSIQQYYDDIGDVFHDIESIMDAEWHKHHNARERSSVEL